VPTRHPIITVEALDETRRLPEPAVHWLAERVRLAAAVLGVGGDVRIRVIDDAAMAKAHEEFAGVPGTTDVLTFDMTDPEEAGPQPGAEGVLRALGIGHRALGGEGALPSDPDAQSPMPDAVLSTNARPPMPDASSAAPPSRTSDSDNDRNPYSLDTDILVCIDEAERQSGGAGADEGAGGGGRGYPVEAELLLYVVHGMLHCLGLDDHEEAEAAQMHRFEDAVLEAVGVGRVFGRGKGH